jgi:hypothetical protein
MSQSKEVYVYHLLLSMATVFICALLFSQLSFINLDRNMYVGIFILSIFYSIIGCLLSDYISYIFRPKLINDIIYEINISNKNYYDVDDVTILINLPCGLDYIISNPVPNAESRCGNLSWKFPSFKKKTSNDIIILKVHNRTKSDAPLSDSNITIKPCKVSETGKVIDELVKKISPPRDDYKNLRGLEKILLAISRNTFALAWRFISLVLIIFILFIWIPPIQILIEPQMISESVSSGDGLIKTITITNLGCKITDLTLNNADADRLSYISDESISKLDSKITNIEKDLDILKKYIDNDLINYNIESLDKSKKIMINLKKNKSAFDSDIRTIRDYLNRVNDSVSNFKKSRKEEKEINCIKDNISEINRIINYNNMYITFSKNNLKNINNGEDRFVQAQIDCSNVNLPGEFNSEISIKAESENRRDVVKKIPINIVVK